MGDVGKRSRRRFLGLIAAGSAAAAAAPASALARVVTPKKKPARPGPGPRGGAGVTPAVAEEIRRQKAMVEQALRVVRDYPLPPGSEPAFVFAPLRAWKKGGQP